jgi:hypothetical protein
VYHTPAVPSLIFHWRSIPDIVTMPNMIQPMLHVLYHPNNANILSSVVGDDHYSSLFPGAVIVWIIVITNYQINDICSSDVLYDCANGPYRVNGYENSSLSVLGDKYTPYSFCFHPSSSSRC